MTTVRLDLATITTREVLAIEEKSRISVTEWGDRKGAVVVAALVVLGNMDEEEVMDLPFLEALGRVEFPQANPTPATDEPSS